MKVVVLIGLLGVSMLLISPANAHRAHGAVSRPLMDGMYAAADRVFEFNPRSLRWRAYDGNGKLVRSGRASGGSSRRLRDIGRSARTPIGHFRVYKKGYRSCRSSKYPLPRGGARMPYCMHFHRGYAIHGSGNVPNYNASHGCIRVLPGDAKWLNQKFMRIGTRVIVKSY